MMRGVYRYLAVAALALILTGCIPREQKPAPVEEVNPGVQQPVQPESNTPGIPAIPSYPGPIETPGTTIPEQSKGKVYDWSTTVRPMVDRMLKAEGGTRGSVLLVDSVINHTNGNLQTGKATDAVRGALAANNKFTLVSTQQLSMAKQQLGLSPQDSLGSRSKAIGIARNVGAQYVLYTSASGNVNAPVLKMQLMLVQNGEIVWSGNSAVL